MTETPMMPDAGDASLNEAFGRCVPRPVAAHLIDYR